MHLYKYIYVVILAWANHLGLCLKGALVPKFLDLSLRDLDAFTSGVCL